MDASSALDEFEAKYSLCVRHYPAWKRQEINEKMRFKCVHAVARRIDRDFTSSLSAPMDLAWNESMLSGRTYMRRYYKFRTY
jgi:hypothetical protein